MSSKQGTAHCVVLSRSGAKYKRNHLSSAVSICDLVLYSRNSSLSPHTGTCMDTCTLAHTYTHSSMVEGGVWHLDHFCCYRGLLWSWGEPFQHQTLTARRMLWLCFPEGSGWMEECVCLPVNSKPTWVKTAAEMQTALTVIASIKIDW